MWTRSLATALTTLALAGCAQVPTFRNVVYDNVSSTAQVLSPYGAPRWNTTDFRLSPGMVFNATNWEPANPLTKSAGLLGEVDGCPQTVFMLNKTQPLKPLMNPVHAPYDMKIVVASPFANQALIDAFLSRPGLQDIPPNALTYIRQIDYEVTNIRVFEASPQQLDQAIKQVKGDPYCSLKINPLTSQIVRRIYVGNVSIAVRWDRGYNLALGVLANRIQNSLRYNVNGTKVIFAVETDRVALF